MLYMLYMLHSVYLFYEMHHMRLNICLFPLLSSTIDICDKYDGYNKMKSTLVNK